MGLEVGWTDTGRLVHHSLEQPPSKLRVLSGKSVCQIFKIQYLGSGPSAPAVAGLELRHPPPLVLSVIRHGIKSSRGRVPKRLDEAYIRATNGCWVSNHYNRLCPSTSTRYCLFEISLNLATPSNRQHAPFTTNRHVPPGQTSLLCPKQSVPVHNSRPALGDTDKPVSV